MGHSHPEKTEHEHGVIGAGVDDFRCRVRDKGPTVG